MKTVEVCSIRKQKGKQVLLEDVSFSLDNQKIYGVLGLEDSGALELVKILAGIFGVDEGSVHVCDKDLLRKPLEAKRSIGFCTSERGLYPDMQVGEFLRFACELKMIPKKQRPVSILRACEFAGISDLLEAIISGLSREQYRRVCFAQMILADPMVMILEDPFKDLEDSNIKELTGKLRLLADNHTVIVRLHSLSEAKKLCDEVLIMSKGNLLKKCLVSEIDRSEDTDESNL